MSMKPSVGRLTATRIDGRSASTQENSVVTNENDLPAVKPKPAAKPKKDRSGLCTFTFADGRQCRNLHYSRHPHLCYFHAQKEAASLAAKQAGEAISSFFYGDYLSAGDLSTALGRVFSAVAEGHIKPKAATALAYLGQTLNQSVQLAQHEYANVFGGNVWRKRVAECLEPSPPDPVPPTQPAPPRPARESRPEPEHAPAPAPPSSSTSPSVPTQPPQAPNPDQPR